MITILKRNNWWIFASLIIIIMILCRGNFSTSRRSSDVDVVLAGVSIADEAILNEKANFYTNKIKSNFKELNNASKKRSEQLKYVNQYSSVAIQEMNKYGVPASITLAQAILESQAGKSELSSLSNNHFGIKAGKKYCKDKGCVTYSDDTPTDKFKKYNSVWESFRDHSKLLNADRYKSLHNYPTTDYINWAYGLKEAGYATDKNYPKKLISLIEKLELYYYDI